MKVISLLDQETPGLNLSNLDTELGDGADGQVFSFKDPSNRVIKLSVLFDWDSNSSLLGQYQIFKNKIQYVIDNPNSCKHLCKVFDFGFVLHSKRKLIVGYQDYLVYYYVMEKLLKLSEDERKVFQTIICHEDRNLVKRFSSSHLNEVLNGLSKGLEFNPLKVKEFYDLVNSSPVIHNDINVRNIMKTESGDYKLVDLDRITILRL